MKFVAMLVLFAGSASAARADAIAYEFSRFTWPGGTASTSPQPANVYIPGVWIGQAINLDPAAPSSTITGFDIPLLNRQVGTVFAASDVRMRVRIYDNYSPSGSPVFGGLLSEQVITSPVSIPFNSNPSYINPSSPLPSFALPVPVTATSYGPIGIAYILEVFSGGAWATSAMLPSVFYSAVASPMIGSSAMPAGNGAYAGGVTPGNFESSNYVAPSSHPMFTYRGIDVRVWVAVPSPSATAMFGVGCLLIARRRRA